VSIVFTPDETKSRDLLFLEFSSLDRYFPNPGSLTDYLKGQLLHSSQCAIRICHLRTHTTIICTGMPKKSKKISNFPQKTEYKRE
jgi:hypothetical protein